jgi:hypothetical protein
MPLPKDSLQPSRHALCAAWAVAYVVILRHGCTTGITADIRNRVTVGAPRGGASRQDDQAARLN